MAVHTNQLILISAVIIRCYIQTPPHQPEEDLEHLELESQVNKDALSLSVVGQESDFVTPGPAHIGARPPTE